VSCSKRLSNIKQGAGDFLRDQDAFGQPIPLNFHGDDMFKTMPGGVLSLLMSIIIFLYFVLKLKYMINREEWGITQQVILQTPEELTA